MRESMGLFSASFLRTSNCILFSFIILNAFSLTGAKAEPPYESQKDLWCVSDSDELRSIEVRLIPEKDGSSATLRDFSSARPFKEEFGCYRTPLLRRKGWVEFGVCSPLAEKNKPESYSLEWGGFTQLFSLSRKVSSETVEYFLCNEVSGLRSE
jgi:hypothetical protein